MQQAENSKICNFETFWPIIQQINGWSSIPNKLLYINRVMDKSVLKSQILLFFVCCIASILMYVCSNVCLLFQMFESWYIMATLARAHNLELSTSLDLTGLKLDVTTWSKGSRNQPL